MLPALVMSIRSAADSFKMIYLMEKMVLIRALLVTFTGLFKQQLEWWLENVLVRNILTSAEPIDLEAGPF